MPIGLLATVWAYHTLRELGERRPARIDWWGNATFALGLVGVMVGITYGIQPYGGHTMGWTSPLVLASLIGGVALLAVFCVIEPRVDEPMFHLELFRIRAFAAGNLAALLAAMGRGGLQFILIIWLQGIWLPRARLRLLADAALGRHLHAAADRRLPRRRPRVGLPLRPLRRAPVRDRRDAARGARASLLLIVLPVDFAYVWFALILLLNGIGMGLFSSPNSAGVMNSPAAVAARRRRGHARDVHELGERALDRRLLLADDRRPRRPACRTPCRRPASRTACRAADAPRISHLPPVATLFASFLGYNPMETLLGPHVLARPAAGPGARAHRAQLLPAPDLGPFHTALVYAFVFAIVACLVAAVASLLRGGKYHHAEADLADGPHGARAASSRRAERPSARQAPAAETPV